MLPPKPGDIHAPHRCHGMPEKFWELSESHLPGGEGTRGFTASENRNFLNAVFCILWTGAPWGICRLTMETEKYPRRFCRWRARGVRARVHEILISETAFEWLMIDASRIRASLHAAGAHGRNGDGDARQGTRLQDGPGRGCAWDASQLFQEGPWQVCPLACRLIAGIDTEYLLAE